MPGHWKWVKSKARKVRRKYQNWNESSMRRKVYNSYKRGFKYARHGGPINYYRSKLPRARPWSLPRFVARQGYRFARRRVSFKYTVPRFGVQWKSVRRAQGDYYGSRPYRYGRKVTKWVNRAGRWWYNSPRQPKPSPGTRRRRTTRRRYYA